MGKAYHKKLGVHKAATAGKGKAMNGGNGKRAGGAGPGGGSKAVGGASGGGWGGSSTFSSTDHSIFETVTWQTYQSLTITRSSTAATAGEGMGKLKGAGGGNARRSGAIKGVGATGRGGAKGAGGAGGGGWGGAPTFATIGYIAVQTDTNEYHGCSSEHGALFSPTAHGTDHIDD